MEGFRGSSSSSRSSNSGGSEPDVSSSSGWQEEEEALGGGGAVPSSTSDVKTTLSAVQDPNFTAADSNSGSTGKSFVPCKVCGDKASGYHYGVTSCEGCKGFFRRSIQKKIEYRCLRDEKCLVIRLNRNRCQFCRFKKCLDVGMSRDSVRYGRVPKRSRERLEEQQRVVSSGQQQQIETEELESTRDVALYNLTLIMAQAHHTHCPYTELKTRGLQRKPAIFSLNEFQTGSSDTTPDSLEQQKIVMWQHFATALTPLIQAVVDFAKKIPGFIELTQDDQLLLIKNGFFEMWVVYSSRLSCPPSDSTITFYDGSYITRQQVELMFDYEFVVGIFNFVASLNSMELNDTETALLVAIVLITSERQGLYDHKTIDKLQERLMEALKVQVAKNRPAEPNAFPLLMMKMPELRSLGAKHAEHLHWFRANWLRLRLPPLFAEIFDINKLDDAMPAGQQQ